MITAYVPRPDCAPAPDTAMPNLCRNTDSLAGTLREITTAQEKTMECITAIYEFLFSEHSAPEVKRDFDCFGDEISGARAKATMILSAVSELKTRIDGGK